MAKTLTLSLKKKWWDLIQSGEKTEEYRELKPYWINRICDGLDMEEDPCGKCALLENVCKSNGIEYKGHPCQRYDKVMFTLGYPKRDDKERHMLFNIKMISVGAGKEEWGAIPNTNYIVIQLGERISL